MKSPSLLPAAVSLCALLGVAGLGHAAEDGKPEKPDPQLGLSVKAIQEAFTARHAALLRPLLDATGKIYMGVKAIAPEAGYYSPDQFLVLLNLTFAHMDSSSLRTRIPSRGSSGDEVRVAFCPAVWVYYRRGERKETNLQFYLARREQHWILSEIRETR